MDRETMIQQVKSEYARLAQLASSEHITGQSPQHHPEGSVWNHTLLVVDEAAKIKEQSADPRTFMWAALLHDLGKPSTTMRRKSKITSYDHDKVGAQLEPTSAGSVYVDGDAVTAPSSKIGYMPQKDQLFPWRTIWANVTLGLELQHQNTAQRQAYVRELLARYGLSEFVQKIPSQLSGGMRQRCALIRTLATDPRILLLDEPFSALDYQTRLSVSTDIYTIIRQERKTALLVTHDISESISLSDRVIVLSKRPGAVKAIHTLIGTVIAVLLWWSDFLSRVLDPYLVVLNALPKTALGPIFIVWIGAGPSSIIAMTLAISLIVTMGCSIRPYSRL